MQEDPLIWAIHSEKHGENSQILALAEALGHPFEEKKLAYRKGIYLPAYTRSSRTWGIDHASSDPLEPPWPDLVISTGVRNEPVARWIKQASQGKTRLVFIGRTWANYKHFDLIITTPQYRLPKLSNIQHNRITMHRITPQRLEEDLGRWKERLAHLPKPHTVVLLGGRSGPFMFGANAARDLAGKLNLLAARSGGSILATTSTRTSPEAAHLFESCLKCQYFMHYFDKDQEDNPYFALLKTADHFIVTSDSIAMISDAVAAGKSLWLYDLDAAQTAGTPRQRDRNVHTETYRLLMRFGPRRLSRNIRLVHQVLLTEGRAAWFGKAPSDNFAPLPDIDNTLKRIRALLTE